MIHSRKELNEYLALDAINYKVSSVSWLMALKNRIATNPINTQYLIWRYIYNLRHAEYHQNLSLIENKNRVSIFSLLHTISMVYYFKRLKNISYKLGIQIPPNTVGKGLQIWHYGYIIINPKVKIGNNCTIYPGVVIGHKGDGTPAPVIGDNVFIGSGAKIIGAIHIGNSVTIAPNAVVTKDVPDNSVVGGIPAKIIKIKTNESSSN